MALHFFIIMVSLLGDQNLKERFKSLVVKNILERIFASKDTFQTIIEIENKIKFKIQVREYLQN